MIGLTPTCVGGFHVGPPHTGEPNPLGDESAHGIESKSAPPEHDGGSAEHQARVILRATVAGKLEAPVQRTEEG